MPSPCLVNVPNLEEGDGIEPLSRRTPLISSQFREPTLAPSVLVFKHDMPCLSMACLESHPLAGIPFSRATAAAWNVSAALTNRIWVDRIPQDSHPGASGISPGHLVGPVRFERTTYAVSRRCSTTELRAHVSHL